MPLCRALRRAALRALSLGMLVLPACAPSGPAAHGPADAPTTATTTSTPSASAPAQATPESAPATPAASTSSAAAPAPGSAAPPRPAPAVAFPRSPKPIEPKHGGQYWAVFLALGKPGPDHERLADAWTATKLPSVRGVGCHEGPGAPSADEAFLAVYFRTERDAKAFAQGVKPEGPRVANVKVFCLD